MSFDKREDRLRTAWVWIAFVVFFLGVILFTTYGYMLGPISHDHGPWSSFGSLLSGFFMVASTGATVATLLFLAHQNKQIQNTNAEQQKVTERQLAAINFEQYINHRRFFLDRLNELQSFFANKFVFENSEEIYNKVFPLNSPTNLEFTAEISSTSESQNFLGKLGSELNRLDEFLTQSSWDKHGTRKLIGLLINTSSTLNLRMTNEVYDGDVIFNGKRTALNIYSIHEFLDIAKATYNSFSFYTGNPTFVGLDLLMTRFARDSLMEYFLEDRSDLSTLKVLKLIPGLEIIERIYFNLCEMKDVDFWLLQPSYSALLDVFSSRESVMKLRDKTFVDELADVGCVAAFTALSSSKSGDEGHTLLKQTHEYFNILLSRNQ